MQPHPLTLIARYILIGMIWSGLMLMITALAQSSSVTDSTVGMVFIAVIGAITVSLVLLRGSVGTPLVDQHADSVRKRKNISASGADPMSLLTDDNIAELRAEFKDELRRRYLQGLDEDGSGDQMASFESLLDDREQRKRR